MIRIGIDTGGTFTDVVAVVTDATGGRTRRVSTKTPSTPADPSVAFLRGVTLVLDRLGAGPADVESVRHGTTVATNHLLQGAVTSIGLITTDGYESILEIARQSVPDGYGNSYFWVKPDRIVPADRVRTIRGRLAYNGSEIRPLNEDDVRAAARFFKDREIRTVGVCLMHSYANPEHERRVRDILMEEYPEATVSISSEVLREYREYERSITTLVDAAVKPNIRNYVNNIANRLREFSSTEGEQRDIPFYVMKSNGGVLSAKEVVHQPITTVLSGPAAGALGAALIAGVAGVDQVLTCDGGGTSTDVTVVVGGEPALTTEGRVGVYPSKIPMIDVVTVGAGGGSIAWMTPEGTLRVGPQSAGADPGPLCYAKGGNEPTITDAHVLLGRIPPHLLGGEIPLDTELARKGVEELAHRLGLEFEACATGILEVSAWNQANALRQITVKRGLDVRDFTLVTFGGSGSLLACRLIDILGLKDVLVPLEPGNVSAFGLLTVDVRNDYVQTHVSRHDRLEIEKLQAGLDALAAEAERALEDEGFGPDQRQYARSADLRYFGQAFEVRVPVGDGPITQELMDEAAERFHQAHRELYGYDFRNDPHQHVEWVNLRVSGIGPIKRPELAEIAPGTGADDALTGTRQAYFDEWVTTRVYDRARLGAGDELEGPAVIEEFSSTIPVHPGFRARIDTFGNIRLSKTSDSNGATR